jgi:hypothetical protein
VYLALPLGVPYRPLRVKSSLSSLPLSSRPPAGDIPVRPPTRAATPTALPARSVTLDSTVSVGSAVSTPAAASISSSGLKSPLSGAGLAILPLSHEGQPIIFKGVTDQSKFG